MNATQHKIQRCQTLKELRELALSIVKYKFMGEKGRAKIERSLAKRSQEIKAKKGARK
jgi:hypothetical protein